MDDKKTIAKLTSVETVLPSMLKGCRIIGWGFFIMGSISFIYLLLALKNPAATIVVNGTETSDPHTKLMTALIAAIFPLAGGVLAFTPRRLAEKILGAHLQRCREFMDSLRKGKNDA